MPLRLNGSTSGYAELAASATAGDVVLTIPNAAGTLDRLNRAGNVIQVVNYQTSTMATGTGIIPADNTTPQNTEGTEFMSLAITPTNSSNLLKIDVNASVTVNSAITVIGALFQDSTADALASGWVSIWAAGRLGYVTFTHYMTANTTSSTTFKVRLGGQSASTVTLNGSAGIAYLNNTLSSTITITEIAA